MSRLLVWLFVGLFSAAQVRAEGAGEALPGEVSPRDAAPSQAPGCPMPRSTTDSVAPPKAVLSPPGPELSELMKLNQVFRQGYAEAHERLAKQGVPTIVNIGDGLVLLSSKGREEKLIEPANWHTLKAVDHLPLGIFVVLSGHTDSPLSAPVLQRLTDLRSAAQKTEPTMDKYQLSPAIAARQKVIFEKSLAFIDECLESKLVKASRLKGFCRSMTPLVMGNADDAEALELALLDKVVQEWLSTMTASEKSNLHVIVVSGHMPRQANRVMQYFLLLTGEKQEGGRVVYNESTQPAEQEALNLLATHELDAEIGEAFFGDPWRMHRDVLSDGAAKYLKKHKPLPLNVKN